MKKKKKHTKDIYFFFENFLNGMSSFDLVKCDFVKMG